MDWAQLEKVLRVLDIYSCILQLYYIWYNHLKKEYYMWVVELTKACEKSLKKLHDQKILKIFSALVLDLQHSGPMQPQWSNFSKLGQHEYHCHIKKGKPTYVVCWKVEDKKLKIIEVYYVGTHEKAPY
jgi:mRNA-degrading endonuclease RelE of RelBE toxin-antitoxin system